MAMTEVLVMTPLPPMYEDIFHGNEMAIFDSLPAPIREVLADAPHHVNISQILVIPHVRRTFNESSAEFFAQYLKAEIDRASAQIERETREGTFVGY